MHRNTRVIAAFAAFLFLPILATNGCSSGNDNKTGANALGGGGAFTTSASTSTGAGKGTGGTGGGISVPDASDAKADVEKNPCGSKCGPKELCDTEHIGLDDNCDGTVDEGCTCSAGQVHPCFKGDPSYHNAPGCHDGSMRCTENGTWGPCIGGVHATPDQKCYENNEMNCHAISSTPFAQVALKGGTGTFSNGADPGSETYTVVCPTGVAPCPSVATPDLYTPIQSGEYVVTYDKTVSGTPSTCTFSLFVGAPGLRVELSWEHPDPGGEDSGVDLDLHLHKPNDTGNWAVSGNRVDCGYNNCTADDYPGDGPQWFPGGNVPPAPVNWDKNPNPDENTCYFAPEGNGDSWRGSGMGCHNPRLDADNTGCDSSITDSTDDEFCYPENINVDYPPPQQWMRIGVYYYTNSGQETPYSVHPVVKLFCNGELAAELGDGGYYVPTSPVTFTAADGAQTHMGNIFWEVADVAFPQNAMCSTDPCIVKPIYADETAKTPFLITDTVAQSQFIPAYPAPPP